MMDLIRTVLTSDNISFMFRGMLLSIEFSVVVIFFSFIIGTILGILRAYGNKIVKNFVIVYVEIFRNTPLLLWILFARFSLPQVFAVTSFQSVVIMFVIFASAGLSEVIRGGLASVDKGQFEAAKAQGFTFIQTLRYIVLPQVFKNIVPQILQSIISTLKDSSYLSTVGIADFLFQARVVMGHIFEPSQIIFLFGYIAMLYFIIDFGISLVVRYMTSKKRSSRKRSRQMKKGMA